MGQSRASDQAPRVRDRIAYALIVLGFCVPICVFWVYAILGPFVGWK